MAGDCVEYQGTKNAKGYGVLPKAVNGSRLAHRAALAEQLGRPVQGFVLHSCDNPPCINPDHLREGTQAENVFDAVLRGRVKGGRSEQTHCVNGHELTPDNVSTYFRQSTHNLCVARRCLACRREASKRSSEKRKFVRQQRRALRERKVA